MDDIQKQYQNNDKHQEELEEDEINLIDYFRVIFKYRRMILLICGVAVVMTAIISLLMPKIYSATASIIPPIDIAQRESELAGALGGGSSLLSKAIGVTSIVDMYAGILESRVVVDVIIDRFDLMKAYEEKKYKSNVRRKLRNNTVIKVSGEGIVKIMVEDKDPNRAAAMANAYAEELDRQNKRLSSGQATNKRIFIENRLTEIDKEFSNIPNIPTRRAKVLDTLYQTLTIEYELARIEEVKSMPTIQILDKAVVPELKCKPRRRQMVMLSGIAALFFAVFAAFAREYVAKMKKVQTEEQCESLSKPGLKDEDERAFAELESRRKIVQMQRKKRVQENESYSQEAQTAEKE